MNNGVIKFPSFQKMLKKILACFTKFENRYITAYIYRILFAHIKIQYIYLDF